MINAVDVTSESSVEAAIQQCPDAIDILINNAGILALDLITRMNQF